MPKRQDIKSILILGAGPIVIGQACEFDYAGVQACKALKEEGYRIILVNSNPATVMTDVDMADATYIEPLDWQVIANIIEQERPDAILPTMGGQTALNCALSLSKQGVLQQFGVEMIGVHEEAIDKAEDRERFRQLMHKIGLETPKSDVAHTVEQALQIQTNIGFPTIIRPSFTLGGSGGGIAYNREEFIEICEQGLEQSPTKELLIEESILGWKEFELEVVRDAKDNCIIVCSIENLDPMGVHTGDSITVAPAQTLTDKEYQFMRNAAFAVLREIGVTTGGSNVQFGVNPRNGRLVVIEMNPRVSRSSALASKATGFPIARVAAKLAVGYTLDELGNELTGNKIPCSFEPSIDYVVTKIPRFNFEKFPQTDAKLTTQMKSVGEAMAIGRSFQESLQKAIRSLEVGLYGFESLIYSSDFTGKSLSEEQKNDLKQALQNPTNERLWLVADAFRVGFSIDDVYQLTAIDPWFLVQVKDLVEVEQTLVGRSLDSIDKIEMHWLKQKGFADAYLAGCLGVKESAVRQRRLSLEVHPVYKRVDSCGAEFASTTAYLYSTYENVPIAVGSIQIDEVNPTQNKKVMVLGSGPNRIGQGIEFDYCCVHAALALKAFGYETIMVNCNPETVSTDYDISDRLYFEPLTFEDVSAIAAIEKPDGIIVQYGGQTPLKLAHALENAGYTILGTSPDAIDHAEDRERFHALVQKLNLQQPPSALARNLEQALKAAQKLTFPILVRPSYVLGGRAMQLVYTLEELEQYIQHAVKVSNDAPVLLDHFLKSAIELDVDAISDGQNVLIAGIMEHIEEAGVHSGDSSCVLPPHSISAEIQASISEQMRRIALELGVIGLINAQFAIQDNTLYVLEVNPRASRTIPFVSKATGLSLVHMAVGCMLGKEILSKEKNISVKPNFYSVKEPVFPFHKFPGVDAILGPEMKSTGEVMGIGDSFPEAFAKGQLAAGNYTPSKGYAFLSVRDADKPGIVEVGRCLVDLGFTILATRGTANYLAIANVPHQVVNKVREGRPHIVDMIKNGEVSFIINTTEGSEAIRDSYTIRRSAMQYKISYKTTLAGGKAVALAMAHDALKPVRSLQALYSKRKVTV